MKQLVPPDQVDDTVDGIAAMIDGFFWENATDCSAEDLMRARRICWNYAVLLDSLAARHALSQRNPVAAAPRACSRAPASAACGKQRVT